MIICVKYSKELTTTILTTPNADEDVEHQELLFLTNGNAKWDSLIRRQFGSFLQSLILFLPYNLVIMLLDIYPDELKTFVLTKTCT